ncbi:MAG TPA: HD domain-containing phosphohydrolase [Thermoanaerobaculia bacterium]|nr:HD domain-containing phosphohydrolase [Thermoanaerobaculia bacterium]
MSVVNPQPQAAPAPGAAFAYYRSGRRTSRFAAWFGQGRGVRVAVSFACGLAGELARGWSGGALFPLTPAISLTAGVLFGGLGILGASLGQLAAVWFLLGNAPAALLLAASFASSGIAGWLVFRFVPRLGRGLPNLQSFLWLLAAGLGGGLAGALPAFLPFHVLPLVEAPGAWVWAWSSISGALVSVPLLAPPLLLLADRRVRRWMVPLPEEVFEPSLRPEREIPWTGEETVVIPPPAPEGRRDLGLLTGAAMVLAAAGVALVLVRLVPGVRGWAVLLYLLPVLWAALHYGLRGGILAASGSGVCHLVGLAILAAISGSGLGSEVWSGRADLLILSLAGALVGWSRQRETAVREELVETNRLLRRDLVRVSDALIHAIEAKDVYTGGHLRRVSEYAVAVGEKLGLRGRDLETLHYASLLHDVGKLGVPESVLRKEGPLDAGETEVMRRHPEIGARMLEKLDLLAAASPLVLYHQERYDGEVEGRHPGYPRGLAGEQIPLGARIIAVVDAYDAMTTNRPYREALAEDDASAILRRERGRQFDPKVVDAFLDSLAERPWRT